jgi:hypothetical protein
MRARFACFACDGAVDAGVAADSCPCDAGAAAATSLARSLSFARWSARAWRKAALGALLWAGAARAPDGLLFQLLFQLLLLHWSRFFFLPLGIREGECDQTRRLNSRTERSQPCPHGARHLATHALSFRLTTTAIRVVFRNTTTFFVV